NVTIDDQAQSESGTFTFTVTLSTTADHPITVDYTTTAGSATAGSDYVTQSGTLTFAPGTTTQPITITVNDDSVLENIETFQINLSNPRFDGAADSSRVDITDSQGLGAITDNETATLSIASMSSVSEGGGLQSVGTVA